MDTNGKYMNKNFCDYETSLRLKNLGFDEKTIGRYYEWKDKKRIPDFNLPLYNHSSLFRDKELIIENRYETKNENGYIETHSQMGFVDWNSKKDGIYNIYSAPLYQQVTDWLREQHRLNITINIEFYDSWCYGFINEDWKLSGKGYKPTLERLIDYCLTILENQIKPQ